MTAPVPATVVGGHRLGSAAALVVCDDELLWLVDTILASGVGVLDEESSMVWFPGDDLLAARRPRGLPIDNLNLQFWSNSYLDPFDHFVKHELRCPASCALRR